MGLGACDLRTTKPDGNPWDFSKKADRKMAMDKIDQETPDWVIGSPPCTPFCAWNQHMNYPKMDRERVESLMKEGRMHLEFMAKVYRKQYRRGRFFLHEHPATAVSWSEQSIDQIAKLPGVFVTKADQCQYSLVSNSDDGKPFPALKPTKFMTNAEPMSKLLMKRCTKDHKHQQLVSGRCADAAFYPTKLVKTIIKGMRASRNDSVYAVVESDVMATATTCKKLGGGHIKLHWDERNFKPVYKDEYTMEILPPILFVRPLWTSLTTSTPRFGRSASSQ